MGHLYHDGKIVTEQSKKINLFLMSSSGKVWSLEMFSVVSAFGLAIISWAFVLIDFVLLSDFWALQLSAIIGEQDGFYPIKQDSRFCLA